MTTKENFKNFHLKNIKCYEHLLNTVPKKSYYFLKYFSLNLPDKKAIKHLKNNIKQAQFSLSKLDEIFGG